MIIGFGFFDVLIGDEFIGVGMVVDEYCLFYSGV